jgi:hypothetical protein
MLQVYPHTQQPLLDASNEWARVLRREWKRVARCMLHGVVVAEKRSKQSGARVASRIAIAIFGCNHSSTLHPAHKHPGCQVPGAGLVPVSTIISFSPCEWCVLRLRPRCGCGWGMTRDAVTEKGDSRCIGGCELERG